MSNIRKCSSRGLLITIIQQYISIFIKLLQDVKGKKHTLILPKDQRTVFDLVSYSKATDSPVANDVSPGISDLKAPWWVLPTVGKLIKSIRLEYYKD